MALGFILDRCRVIIDLVVNSASKFQRSYHGNGN